MKPVCTARRRSRDGFTLIEVLAALTIFAVVAAGLAANTVATIRSNKVSRNTSVAAALAGDKLEQLRALDPSTNPADLTPNVVHVDARNPMNELGWAGGVFTRTWAITPGTPVLGLSTVVVNVSWTYAGYPRATQVVGYLCGSQACI